MVEDSRYTFSYKDIDGLEVTISGNRAHIIDILNDFKTFMSAISFSPLLVDRIVYDETVNSSKLDFKDTL